MRSLRPAAVRRITAALAVLALSVAGSVLATAPAAQAGTVRTAVSLTGPTSGTYGTAVRLTGTAWRYGTSTKLVRATVWLQRATHGRTNWGNLTKTSTSSTGTFAFAVVQSSAYDYRAYYPGNATYAGNYSAKVYPAVLQRVIFDSFTQRGSYPDGGGSATVYVSGRVFPTPPNGTLGRLQYFNRTRGVWVDLGYAGTRSGRFDITATAPKGTAQYRVYTKIRLPFAAGYSPAVNKSVYVRRGLFTKPVSNTGSTYINYSWNRSGNVNYQVSTWITENGSGWAYVDTTGCLTLEGTASISYHASAPNAPVLSYTAGSRQFYAARRYVGHEYAFNLGGVRTVKITVSNPNPTLAGLLLEARAVCAN